jgi:hypothetical protein
VTKAIAAGIAATIAANCIQWFKTWREVPILMERRGI